MSSPPHQAYWVVCRASCRNRLLFAASSACRVIITLPMVKAGAGGTGSR
jgi:hypothetical protein